MDFFSRGLEREYRNKGIFVQSVLPLFVSSAMSKMRPSLTVPSASTFVRSAAATIGYDTRTFGYLIHTLQVRYTVSVWWVCRLRPWLMFDTAPRFDRTGPSTCCRAPLPTRSCGTFTSASANEPRDERLKRPGRRSKVLSPRQDEKSLRPSHPVWTLNKVLLYFTPSPVPMACGLGEKGGNSPSLLHSLSCAYGLWAWREGWQ